PSSGGRAMPTASSRRCWPTRWRTATRSTATARSTGSSCSRCSPSRGGPPERDRRRSTVWHPRWVRPRQHRGGVMSYGVDFETVSTEGLESSPVAAALAGLRANEARYIKNKYDHVFTVEPASKAKKTIDYVSRILKEERDIVIGSPALEATEFEAGGIRF